MKIIITGATGMVGEGVLLECLSHPQVLEVLIVHRSIYSGEHPKLKQLIVRDFFDLGRYQEHLDGYDACFYCAGVSSIGMKEKEYNYLTYDTTLYFAKLFSKLNSQMTFTYVSGSMTNSTEQGKIMWARVKGKTENDLMKLPFKNVYNFRPGFILPAKGQNNIKVYYRIFFAVFAVVNKLFPNLVCTMKEIGQAMINCVTQGYDKKILEIKDIKICARG